MDFLKLLLKILVLLASVFVAALPFLLNWSARKKDKKKGISYKYFRVLVYCVVYVIVATVLLRELQGIYRTVASWSWVQWIAARISISARTQYYIKVFTTIFVNALIGFVYLLLQKLVRIGLKKKNLVMPAKKDGEFNWKQKAERAIIRFFHNETWFLVGRILKCFNLLLSALYILVFIFFQIPALSAASWIPYDFLLDLYTAGYIYPVLTLLILWDMYFFLAGIELVEKECPEVLNDDMGDASEIPVDIALVDKECRRYYSDRYLCNIEIPAKETSVDIAAEGDSAAVLVGQAMEKDSRNPKLQKALYINCLDQLSKEKNLVIEGGFFSEFGMYFIRYISMILARGENIVFICNSDEQIEATYDYIYEGLSNISSLYCKGVGAKVNDYDSPIWGILKVSSTKTGVEKSSIDDHSVLITTPDYICSSDFEMKHKEFIQQIKTVIFIDTVETLTLHAPLMSLMNTRFQHIAKTNAVIAKNGGRNIGFRSRFVFRPIQYVCFDDSTIPGLDKVLKNLLSVDFETTDCMQVTPETIISCYNHEGARDDEGKSQIAQFVHTDEELGLIMNMIMLCRSKGISQISVFPNNALPYNYMIESAVSNSAKLPFALTKDNIRVNKYFYNPDKYSAIIAFDPLNNLPDAIRRYARLAGDKPTLINIISRPYMLRDYYASKIADLWQGRQIIRIPMREGLSRDVALRILVKANSGGISEEELFVIAGGDPELASVAAGGNANAVMIALLKYFGISGTDSSMFYSYFEYSTERDFDENGKYKLENRIHLRKQGKLYDLLEGRNLIRIYHGDRIYVLPLAKDRLTQQYIPEQNLLYNGDIYHITAIDSANGVIHAKLATGGKNEEAYEYIQTRRYTVDNAPESVQMLSPVKRVQLQRSWEGVTVNEVTLSVYRAPMEVVTDGYYVVDPHTLDCNPKTNKYISIKDQDYSIQTYRRFGALKNPTFTSEQVIKHGGYIDNNGASVLSVKIGGSFGENADKTALLASVMVGEIIKSMFPYVSDCIAVVPVLKNKNIGEESGCADIIKLYPQISLAQSGAENEIELLIIEDCSTDLGVISTLTSSGDDPLHLLFAPVLEYLDWYESFDDSKTTIKKNYLYYGGEGEPACFDFKAMYALAKVLGDDKYELNYVDLEELVEYTFCDFCGKRFVKGENIVQLDDGRMMCRECAQQIVGNNKRALKNQLNNAKLFLENTYGITVDEDYEVCFDTTVKIINTLKADNKLLRRGGDVGLRGYVDPAKKKSHIERDIPAAGISELLVRQLTHTWQLKHVPNLPEELAEGHVALVAVQYLRFLGMDELAQKRIGYYESNRLVSGIGYRKLVRELLKNPQFRNNPFRYVLENQGGSSGNEDFDETPRKLDLGDDYVPDNPDRDTNAKVLFFYERLPEAQKSTYTRMCEAIEKYEATFDAGFASFDDVQTVSRAISYDRPDLFQYKNFSMQGSCVNLIYCMDEGEKQRLMAQIDAALSQFTEGITDTMSAYDVALRVHTNIIKVIDYDTIALERQEQTGIGDTEHDWLRTICGVFINKKAVCAGYAKAVQFLLQKYGLECGYCVGDMLKKDENGKVTAHAWNILKADGEYYYLDATWDDFSNTIQKVKRNEMSYNYFCVTTEEMLRTRIFNWCPTEMPVCTATKCNYHYHNNAVIESYDIKKIKEIAVAAAKRGAEEFSIKCTSGAVFREAFDKLCRDCADCYAVIREAGKANKKIVQTSYRYAPDETMQVITIYFKF